VIGEYPRANRNSCDQEGRCERGAGHEERRHYQLSTVAGLQVPGPQASIHALWTAITMPVLVLRTRQEIMPGFGSILPAAEAERFAAAVPSARVVEIDANHYTITTHDDSIAAIGAFLRTS
jgi:hypothetical protein